MMKSNHPYAGWWSRKVKDKRVFVLSLGGSLIVPKDVDTEFLYAFVSCVRRFVRKENMRFVIVTGGGSIARTYQQAYRRSRGNQRAEEDWIGIAATQLNAQLLKSLFEDDCPYPIITNPQDDPLYDDAPVVVSGGWKPGCSTDYDALILAERYHVDTVLNFSNIRQVYTADPAKDPNAKPLSRMTWQEFLAITGRKWKPGSHFPLDPIAAQYAASVHIRVIIAHGGDMDIVSALIRGEPCTGTTIE